MTTIRDFVEHHYRHFNAAVVRDAARAYEAHLQPRDGKPGGKMMVTLAGAMSTAELGLSLAEMIRQDKVHAITCTGANLEEDVFNLVAHDFYERLPHYRGLSAEAEEDLRQRGMNRVTDTAIPEEEAIRRIENKIVELWKDADEKGERWLPHQYFYRLLNDRTLAGDYQIDPKDSWLIAAAERNLPLFVPGWEDSTLGNIFVAHVVAGDLSSFLPVRAGVEYMAALMDWYRAETGAQGQGASLPSAGGEKAHARTNPESGPVGFFQIGGGIAGDFPICVVPLIQQDLQVDVPFWGYFCQISDSTTSFGSYSGAVPNEKISWGKLAIDTPKFVIESDATIVAPLIFGYLLGW
ncbi:MAG TPA: deoxyhypusine synthase family protein [Thermoanaerobaculia bacterium]|jgi:deoxyhypusine synthase|nr:deoxyhypusine synthase family protein [Thermoanaerobaculia bacterium]